LTLTFEASLSSGEAMAGQRDRKRKELVAQPDKETTVATEKAKVKAKRALARGKVKERARLKSDEALAKVQEALRAAQAKVKLERQARAKAEKALTEAQEAVAAARLKAEQELQAPIRRISFVVRLMVDEHGQPQRTEIEQVEGNRKQSFLGLDGERLVAFMKAYITPVIISEPAAPFPEMVEAPPPGPLKPKTSLMVSNVQVFRLGDPDFVTLILTSEERFIVQARFVIHGPEARSLTTQDSSIQMKIYANEVISGKSQLLTTYSEKLIRDVLVYTVPVEVPGLPSGLYRLFTAVKLNTPVKIAGFYGKTIIHVT
jgi:hypothetical protein